MVSYLNLEEISAGVPPQHAASRTQHAHPAQPPQPLAAAAAGVADGELQELRARQAKEMDLVAQAATAVEQEGSMANQRILAAWLVRKYRQQALARGGLEARLMQLRRKALTVVKDCQDKTAAAHATAASAEATAAAAVRERDAAAAAAQELRGRLLVAEARIAEVEARTAALERGLASALTVAQEGHGSTEQGQQAVELAWAEARHDEAEASALWWERAAQRATDKARSLEARLAEEEKRSAAAANHEQAMWAAQARATAAERRASSAEQEASALRARVAAAEARVADITAQAQGSYEASWGLVASAAGEPAPLREQPGSGEVEARAAAPSEHAGALRQRLAVVEAQAAMTELCSSQPSAEPALERGGSRGGARMASALKSLAGLGGRRGGAHKRSNSQGGDARGHRGLGPLRVSSSGSVCSGGEPRAPLMPPAWAARLMRFSRRSSSGGSSDGGGGCGR